MEPVGDNNAAATTDHEADPSWGGVIRWGGWSLFGAAVLLVVFVAVVVATGQELPVPPEEALDSPATPTFLFIVAVIGEVLLAPGGLALYHTLKRFDRTRMVFATTSWLLATPVFIASRGPIISLARVSDTYKDATDEATKAGYLAAADLGIEIQNTYSTMAVILLSVASILIGSVMLTSNLFGRPIAYVTIAAGIASAFAPFLIMAGTPEAIGIIGLALGAVWQLVIGYRLARWHYN